MNSVGKSVDLASPNVEELPAETEVSQHNNQEVTQILDTPTALKDKKSVDNIHHRSTTVQMQARLSPRSNNFLEKV